MSEARKLALAGAVLLAACQPLPHPFADDRPPASLLAVPDSAGISIGPIAGGPAPTAAKLGAAVAKALRQHDIPASNRTASLASFELAGRIDEGPPGPGGSLVRASWQLRDAKGRVVGERSEQVAATAADWQQGSDDAVARLAAASADALAPLVAGKPPVEVAGDDRLRVRVGPVGGAPGDGDQSLANALAAVLKRQDLNIVDDAKAGADVTVAAQVTITPAKADKQHVKIVWSVRRANGSEVGTVGQENDVPRAMLNAPWGDLAYSVALAAESGILQVVARAGPPSGGKS